MDATTAPCAEKALDFSVTTPLPATLTRAEVMAWAAKTLVTKYHPTYTPGGRTTPEGFDAFGFVRWCAEVAASWAEGHGFVVPADLADLRDYMGWPDHDPSGDSICAAIESWGLQRIEHVFPLKTLPGDIIMTLGNGPDCCVVTDAQTQDRGELVALVWAPHGPEIRLNTAFGRVPCRAYRWPSTTVAGA